MLLGGQQGGLGFVNIAHGFDHDQVGLRRRGGIDHLGKGAVGVFKFQIAIGLEQLSGGAHIQRDIALLPGGFSGQRNARADQFAHAVGLIFQLVAVGAEGVGQQNIRARGGISAVNIAQHIGVGNVPGFRQFARPQAAALQQGAHGAVDKQGAGE